MIPTDTITYLRLIATIIPLITLVFSLYLLILIPQKQQQAAQQLLRKKLYVGSRISTHHGLSGTIYNLSDNFIILALDDGRKIEIVTPAIATIHHEKP
jgi:preprotein translocase YajC subunit